MPTIDFGDSDIGETWVVLAHGKRKVQLAFVLSIKEFILDDSIYQPVPEPRLFAEVPIGGRFRSEGLWYIRLRRTDEAYELYNNMPFDAPNRQRRLTFPASKGVELLIIRDRGRIVKAA